MLHPTFRYGDATGDWRYNRALLACREGACSLLLARIKPGEPAWVQRTWRWPRRRPYRARHLGFVARRVVSVMDSTSIDFHTGQCFVTEHAIRTPGTDAPHRATLVRSELFTRLVWRVDEHLR